MPRDKAKYNEYMRKYMLDRYRKQRLRVIHVLGGKCVKCGSKKNLEIDHKNRRTKSKNVGKAWNHKDIIDEIEKCQLLCKSCHTLKSIRERGMSVAKGKHGTVSSYKYCRCDKCRKAKSEAYYEWKRSR